jgi:hypothetical protein
LKFLHKNYFLSPNFNQGNDAQACHKKHHLQRPVSLTAQKRKIGFEDFNRSSVRPNPALIIKGI